MGRPGKYSPDQMLDAAARLLASDGPSGLNVSGVARDLGAPSGSIYHRFASRDFLVASLWLRTVDRFHDAIAPALDRPDGRHAVRGVALGVVSWTSANPLDAQLLLLHRSSDLLRAGWPEELVARNRAQRGRVEEMVAALSGRVGATTVEQMRRVAFATIDIPYAAVRGHLSRGEPPPAGTEALVLDAVDGVLAGLRSSANDRQ